MTPTPIAFYIEHSPTFPPFTTVNEIESDGFRTHQASVPHPMALSPTLQKTFDKGG
jgi:hypothetical protein